MGDRYRDHVAGTPWTMPQLRDLNDARRHRPMAELAREMGICVRALNGALRRAGFIAPAGRPALGRLPEDVRNGWDRRCRQAFALRMSDGLTWQQAAEAVEWHGSADGLRVAVQGWRARAEIDVTAGHGASARRAIGDHRRAWCAKRRAKSADHASE